MKEPMDIYSKPGTKVRLINDTNYQCGGPERVKRFLNPVQVYTVAKINISAWHSVVYLKEIGLQWGFNTCCFEEVK